MPDNVSLRMVLPELTWPSFYICIFIFMRIGLQSSSMMRTWHDVPRVQYFPVEQRLMNFIVAQQNHASMRSLHEIHELVYNSWSMLFVMAGTLLATTSVDPCLPQSGSLRILPSCELNTNWGISAHELAILMLRLGNRSAPIVASFDLHLLLHYIYDHLLHYQQYNIHYNKRIATDSCVFDSRDCHQLSVFVVGTPFLIHQSIELDLPSCTP